MAQPIDKRTGLPAEPGDEAFVYGQPYSDRGANALAAAKEFLSRHQGPVEPSPEDLAEATQRTTVAREPMSLRGLTDIGESASLPLAGMGMIPSPMSPFLLGASAILAGAGGLRKLIAPETDESRVEGGVQSALSMLPFAGKLRGLGQHAMKRIPVSAEKAYSLTGLEQAVNPAEAKLISGLLESWKQFAKPGIVSSEKKAAKVIHTAAGNKSRIGRMNQQSEAGYRNVPPETNPNLGLLPESGLGTITPAEWRKLGLRQVHQTAPSYPNPEAGWGEDLLANLSRLKIPARARAFATNTPLPE
jgi:hypothetical protein